MGNSGKSERFYFWGAPKSLQMVTAAMKLKDAWLLGKKAMTNLDSILKSRDITLPTKVHLVKAIFFSSIMYGCESWTIRKAEHRKIDASESHCWRRLLRVPWTARRSKQSILKYINLEYSLEGLKLQYFGHLMQRADSLEKTLMLGKIDGKRKRAKEGKMVGRRHWLNGHEFKQSQGEGQRRLAHCSSWGRRGRTWLGDWTTSWLIHVVVQQKLTEHCKATIFQ